MSFATANPMFGGGPPQYQGAFNFNTGMDPGFDALLKIGAPYAFQAVLGDSFTQGQFNPQQNIYDQMQAARHYADVQKAEATAARRDQAQLQKMIEGTMKMASRRELTDAQRQQAFSISRQSAQYMPILSQFLGNQTVDQMFGRTGSAAMMATNMHRGLRTGLDPVTGLVGGSGDSTGTIASEVFEQLYGPKMDPSGMKGITAGTAGEMFAELQMQGLAGPGYRSFKERVSGVPNLREDEVSRIVDRVIQQRAAAGQKEYASPDEGLIGKVRGEVQSTIDKVKTGGDDLTATQLSQMAGGDDLLRVGDSRQIADRLKGMAGAVSAMRDIFGDAGNPNAPMRQLLSSLDALTQGGLGTMSSERVESLVRKTHALSQQTGMTVEGILGLTAQTAQITDSMGLVRGHAVGAAHGAAAFGAAVGDTQRLDIPVFGSMSKEELTVMDARNRAAAAGSHSANTANAALRLADEGLLKPDEGTAAAAYLEALKTKQANFSYVDPKTGQKVTKSTAVTHPELLSMLKAAGVDGSDAQRIIFDTRGNEEYGIKYDTADVIRRAQRDVDIKPRVGNAFGSVIAQRLKDSGLSDVDRQALARAGGTGAASAFFNLSREEYADTEGRNRLLGEAQKKAVMAAAGNLKSLQGMSAPDRAALLAKIESGLGSDQNLGGVGMGELGSMVSLNMPQYQGPTGLWQMFNVRTELAQQERTRQAEVTARMQSNFAGVGRMTFLQRLAETAATGRADTSLKDVAGKLVGGISMEEMAKHSGAVAGMMDTTSLLNDAAKDREEVKDAQGNVIGYRQTESARKKTSDLLARQEAFSKGGRYAQDYLERDGKLRADHPDKMTAGQRAQMETAVQQGGAAYVREKTQVDLSGVTAGDIASTRERAVMAEQSLAELTGGKAGQLTEDERKSLRGNVTDYFDQLSQRVDSLMFDQSAMEQLGRGGLGLVRGMGSDHAKLSRLASEAGVSIGELLEGKVAGKHKDKVAKAKALQASLRTGLDELAKRKGTGVIPGGDAAMTAAERAELAAEQRFRTEVAPDQQKSQLFDRLVGESTDAMSETLNANKAKLQAQLGAGSSLEVFRSLEARDALERMAAEKGLLVGADGKKIGYNDASEEQRRSARQALIAGGGNLSDIDKAEVARLQAQSERLNFLDAQGGGKNVERMEEAMRSFRDLDQKSEAKGRQKIEVTGRVEVTGDIGNLTLSGESKPEFDDTRENAQYGRAPANMG